MMEHNVKRCLRIADEMERAVRFDEQRSARGAEYWRLLSRFYWRQDVEQPPAPMYPRQIAA